MDFILLLSITFLCTHVPQKELEYSMTDLKLKHSLFLNTISEYLNVHSDVVTLDLYNACLSCYVNLTAVECFYFKVIDTK